MGQSYRLLYDSLSSNFLTTQCMRQQSNLRIKETFIYKPLEIVITLVRVAIYSEIQYQKRKVFKGLCLLLIRRGIHIAVMETLKSGKTEWIEWFNYKGK